MQEERPIIELEWLMARLARGPRHGRRARRAFGIKYSNDGGKTFCSAYPVDIGAGGIGIVTQDQLPAREAIVTLDLDSKRIQARVACVTAEKGILRGVIAWRIGARFVLIAPEDRELVERFAKRLPLDPPQKKENQILPDIVLERIFEELVAQERLAPVRRFTRPLVKVTYTGTIDRAHEKLYGFKIESRVKRDSRITVYSSQVYVDGKLTKVEVIPLDNGRPGSMLPKAAPRRKARKIRWRRSAEEITGRLRDLAALWHRDIYAS